MNGPRRKPAGFTLIELLVSSIVILFILMALMGVLSGVSRLSASSREGVVATRDLHAAAEYLVGYPFEGVRGYLENNPGSTPLPGSLAPHPLSALAEESVWIEPLNVASDAVEYRLTVRFRNHKGHLQEEWLVGRRSR